MVIYYFVPTISRVTTLGVFSGSFFFRSFEIVFFFFALLLLYIGDLLHDVEALIHLP